MKAHLITLLVMDQENRGAESCAELLCIDSSDHATTVDFITAEVGPWSDDHKLNQTSTTKDEILALFDEHPNVTWHYIGGEGGEITSNKPFPEVFRREWWYDAGNTYVYQTGTFKDGEFLGDLEIFGEFEDEGYPEWVSAALVEAGDLH